MRNRLMTVALVGSCLASPAGLSAQEALAEPTREVARSVHVLRNADPASLAETLTLHFQGDARILAVTGGTTGALLVTAKDDITREIAALVKTLDAGPKMVSVELVLAEVAPEDAESLLVQDQSPLSRLDELRRAGKAVEVRHVRLEALEGETVTTTTGKNTPIVTRVESTVGARGQSIQYRETGSQVTVLARVTDGSVVLDLKLDETSAKTIKDGDESVPAFVKSKLDAKVRAKSGESVVVRTQLEGEAAKPTVDVVIVTARVHEPRPE